MKLGVKTEIKYKVEPFLFDCFGNGVPLRFGKKEFSTLDDAEFYRKHLYSVKDKKSRIFKETTLTSSSYGVVSQERKLIKVADKEIEMEVKGVLEPMRLQGQW